MVHLAVRGVSDSLRVHVPSFGPPDEPVWRRCVPCYRSMRSAFGEPRCGISWAGRPPSNHQGGQTGISPGSAGKPAPSGIGGNGGPRAGRTPGVEEVWGRQATPSETAVLIAGSSSGGAQRTPLPDGMLVRRASSSLCVQPSPRPRRTGREYDPTCLQQLRQCHHMPARGSNPAGTCRGVPVRPSGSGGSAGRHSGATCACALGSWAGHFASESLQAPTSATP